MTLSVLQQFFHDWAYHNPLSKDQLAHAGKVARILSVGFYHGGDSLYELDGLPGVWHEVCLEQVISKDGSSRVPSRGEDESQD